MKELPADELEHVLVWNGMVFGTESRPEPVGRFEDDDEERGADSPAPAPGAGAPTP